MAADSFDSTVEQLYAGPADRFVANRDAAAKRARAAGDKDLAEQIKQLRRPTAAAGLINRLRRDADHSGIDELLALGERLREAQSTLDVTAMRSLSTERNTLITRLVQEIAETADEPVSAAVRDQLSDTFTAAVADAEARRAVSSGRLVTGLRYSGFGEVDLQDAVAAPLPPDSSPSAGSERETARADAEPADSEPSDPEPSDVEPADESTAAEEQAARARIAAERQLTEARARLAAAREAEDAALQSAALAKRALDAARRTAKTTRARAQSATAEREAAEEAVRTAEAAATGW